jgi:uncharacterized NAD-dependent epimerase/dehydratase family protein
MLKSDQKIAILLHEGIIGSQGKTGLTLLRYSEAPIVAAIDRECAGKSLAALTGIKRQVPIVASVTEALAYEPDVLAIGIAPYGGILPAAWQAEVKDAIAAGLSIVNGLHTPMANIPQLHNLLRPGQWIWDVRQEPDGLSVGGGLARSLSCLRVLTVGTDMSVGKMSTSLELHRTCQKRGMLSKFIATGQSGIMISGEGVPLDAVRVDFAAGAVEQLVMRYGNGHDILHIEGQGSLLHPGSTATLPLLRGSQPTNLILVHRAAQTHIRRYPEVPIPPLPEVVQLYEALANVGGASSCVRVVAIALNTGHLDESDAMQAIEQTQAQTNLPCTDPIRCGADVLLDAIIG